MNVITIRIESKGQVLIPKLIRDQLGIQPGTQLLMSITNENILTLCPIKRSIDMFFGKGKYKNINLTVKEMDQAIEDAVREL